MGKVTFATGSAVPSTQHIIYKGHSFTLGTMIFGSWARVNAAPHWMLLNLNPLSISTRLGGN